MELPSWLLIQDELACVSLFDNTYGRVMNPSVLSPMNK